MRVLHIGLNFHLRVPKPDMGYFEMTLHVGITFKSKFSFRGIQTT